VLGTVELNAQRARDWQVWATAIIRRELAEHDRITTEATGQALSEYVAGVRKQLRAEFAKQLDELRDELRTKPIIEDHERNLPAQPTIQKVRIA
jgi:hypothetical protein